MPNLLPDLARELRATAIERHQRKRRDDVVGVPGQDVEGFEQLGDAVQGEEPRLDRDDGFRAGEQRVEGQHPHRGRAVDDQVVAAGALGGDELGEQAFTAGDRPREFRDGAQADVRRHEVEALVHTKRHVAERCRAAVESCGEHVVDRRGQFVGVPDQAERGVPLGVHVNEQRAPAGAGEERREVDRGGGLAAPALLVDDGDGSHGALLLSRTCGVCRLFGADSPRQQEWDEFREGRASAAGSRRRVDGWQMIARILRSCELGILRSDLGKSRSCEPPILRSGGAGRLGYNRR